MYRFRYRHFLHMLLGSRRRSCQMWFTFISESGEAVRVCHASQPHWCLMMMMFLYVRLLMQSSPLLQFGFHPVTTDVQPVSSSHYTHTHEAAHVWRTTRIEGVLNEVQWTCFTSHSCHRHCVLAACGLLVFSLLSSSFSQLYTASKCISLPDFVFQGFSPPQRWATHLPKAVMMPSKLPHTHTRGGLQTLSYPVNTQLNPWCDCAANLTKGVYEA